MQSKLQQMQEFSIRLYFDQSFLVSYKYGKRDFVNGFGLSPEEERFFPNVLSLSFVVESHGRKFLIAKELSSRVQNFFQSHLNKNEVSITEIIEASIFTRFLESKEFYSRVFCFPHYTGIGPGHENVSKFFFFVKKQLLNNSEECSLLLDISLVLNFHAKLTDLDFYQPFKKMAWFNLGQDVVVVRNSKWIRIQGNWDQTSSGNIANVCAGVL